MVNNIFVTCDMCDTFIKLRIQYGYYDISFNLQCPECSTHIKGKIHLSDREDAKGMKFVNVSKTERTSECYYTIELSAEFPTRKLKSHKESDELELTPFIRNMMFYNDMNHALSSVGDSIRLAEFLNNDWSGLKSLYDLFWNDKKDVLYPKLKSELIKHSLVYLKDVKNDLDATVALHHILLTSSGLIKVISKDNFAEYTEIGRVISNPKNFSEIARFMTDQSIDLNSIEKKCFLLIDKFSSFYNQIIPVVSLRVADTLNRVDREKFGIMTAYFSELTDFYAKSYEWILDNLHLVVALNNIIIRSDYSKCYNEKKYIEIKQLRSKYTVLDFINWSEPLSLSTDNLKSKMRNAIQHYDYEIDYKSQKATFNDVYKGNKRFEEIYLIDFAVLCIENFSMLLYLLEIVYNLRKILLVSRDNKPNFDMRLFNKAEGISLVRRKGPCPCGSKKKFKNCCESKS